MLDLLLFAVILVAVAVIPVMLAARLVGARRRGLLPALAAVILLSALSILIQETIAHDALQFVAVVAGGAAIFALTLGTSLLRGLGVAVVVVGIQVLAAMLFAALLLSL